MESRRFTTVVRRAWSSLSCAARLVCLLLLLKTSEHGGCNNSSCFAQAALTFVQQSYVPAVPADASTTLLVVPRANATVAERITIGRDADCDACDPAASLYPTGSVPWVLDAVSLVGAPYNNLRLCNGIITNTITFASPASSVRQSRLDLRCVKVLSGEPFNLTNIVQATVLLSSVWLGGVLSFTGIASYSNITLVNVTVHSTNPFFTALDQFALEGAMDGCSIDIRGVTSRNFSIAPTSPRRSSALILIRTLPLQPPSVPPRSITVTDSSVVSPPSRAVLPYYGGSDLLALSLSFRGLAPEQVVVLRNHFEFYGAVDRSNSVTARGVEVSGPAQNVTLQFNNITIALMQPTPRLTATAPAYTMAFAVSQATNTEGVSPVFPSVTVTDNRIHVTSECTRAPYSPTYAIFAGLVTIGTMEVQRNHFYSAAPFISRPSGSIELANASVLSTFDVVGNSFFGFGVDFRFIMIALSGSGVSLRFVDNSFTFSTANATVDDGGVIAIGLNASLAMNLHRATLVLVSNRFNGRSHLLLITAEGDAFSTVEARNNTAMCNILGLQNSLSPQPLTGPTSVTVTYPCWSYRSCTPGQAQG